VIRVMHLAVPFLCSGTFFGKKVPTKETIGWFSVEKCDFRPKTEESRLPRNSIKSIRRHKWTKAQN